MGTAIGIFVGMTPLVGIQTLVVLAVVFVTRRFFYFNVTAAVLSTYVSNPLTMVPLYYFWYRLGTWFVPGNATVGHGREPIACPERNRHPHDRNVGGRREAANGEATKHHEEQPNNCGCYRALPEGGLGEGRGRSSSRSFWRGVGFIDLQPNHRRIG